MLTKKWYQSKTVWLNLIASLLGILAFLNADLLKSLGITDPSKLLSVIGIITTIGNLILRSGGQPTVISTRPAGDFVPLKK